MANGPEAKIENKFCKEAKALGCKVRKLNGLGNNDWPDRLVVIPGGAIVMFEFKQPGEGLSPTQEAFHDDLIAIGQPSYVFDNWQEPLALVKRLMK